jgi:hypothetical protein
LLTSDSIEERHYSAQIVRFSEALEHLKESISGTPNPQDDNGVHQALSDTITAALGATAAAAPFAAAAEDPAAAAFMEEMSSNIATVSANLSAALNVPLPPGPGPIPGTGCRVGRTFTLRADRERFLVGLKFDRRYEDYRTKNYPRVVSKTDAAFIRLLRLPPKCPAYLGCTFCVKRNRAEQGNLGFPVRRMPFMTDEVARIIDRLAGRLPRPVFTGPSWTQASVYQLPEQGPADWPKDVPFTLPCPINLVPVAQAAILAQWRPYQNRTRYFLISVRRRMSDESHISEYSRVLEAFATPHCLVFVDTDAFELQTREDLFAVAGHWFCDDITVDIIGTLSHRVALIDLCAHFNCPRHERA